VLDTWTTARLMKCRVAFNCRRDELSPRWTVVRWTVTDQLSRNEVSWNSF